MVGSIMLYSGSIIIAAWGVAHIVPTRSVVSGFEPLSPDNRRILTMEWVAEGLMLCFIGVLVGLVTFVASDQGRVATLVYFVCAAALLVMALWTLITGARTSVIFFKACPVVKAGVAGLFLLGAAQ